MRFFYYPGEVSRESQGVEEKREFTLLSDLFYLLKDIGMKISETGEFGFLDILQKEILSDERGRKRLLVPAGDDAAAWESPSLPHLCTTDLLVEGVHFSLRYFSWRDLGWKSAVVSLSDIAAMGGKPLFAFISLGIPPEVEIENLLEFCRGVMEAAEEYDFALAGGDLSRSEKVIVNSTLVGIATGRVLVRSKAQPGDLIAVTGFTGLSAAGFHMLSRDLPFDEETNIFREAHLRPRPRLREAAILSELEVHAAIDISDGLVQDLARICEASGVGAELWKERVPLHPLLRSRFPERAWEFALSGGEDYELLFTASPEVMEEAGRRMGGAIFVVGRIREERGLVIRGGEIAEEILEGWDHFRAS